MDDDGVYSWPENKSLLVIINRKPDEFYEKKHFKKKN